MTHNYLFLFHVPYGVKKLKNRLQENSVALSIIDAPRKITTECEIALSAQFSAENDYLDYTDENIREVWRVNGLAYQRVWKDKLV
ncbi:putative Se/S carrier-like protein [uncultured Cedecea sp.]|uniref:putative Se/S carrier-like protein n=1 Tax=uncultured Cedecea sp. TaxID=988762 RepID=UPI002610471E|nr:putative Se/S carrier-like protein [uncultured Cedecea sp.]